MSKGTISLGLAASFATLMATGPNAPAGFAAQSPTITIKVLNSAKVSPWILPEAENEAKAILHAAGLETTWIDCPLAGSLVDPGPCSGSTDLVLPILARVMPDFPASIPDALGFALPCHRLQANCRAYIFYPRIEARAADGDATPSVILGHAMAHEIGHLLLGPDHSPFGIMRARWSHHDMQLASRQQLGFVSAQAKLLQAAVSTGNLETDW